MAQNLNSWAVSMAQPTVLDQTIDDDDGQEQEVLEVTASPAAKKQRTEPGASHLPPVNHDEVIPQKFMTKWIATDYGILPFVKNCDTGLIHCGFTKMQVFDYSSPMFGDDKSVLCMSGCEVTCQGPSQCACFCHLLQKDYDARKKLQ